MENTITKSGTLEKTAVFSQNMEKRYELTFDYKGESKKEKAVLIICLNPASNDIMVSDATTNYILNNLLPMGFTTITVCNLCARITNKLKGQDLLDNSDNLDYISTILSERKYNTILLAYGNGSGSSKNVNEEKRALEEILKNSKYTVSEIVDKEELYSRMKVIHPLYSGQRFSGKWKFRKHVFEECGIEKQNTEETEVKES